MKLRALLKLRNCNGYAAQQLREFGQLNLSHSLKKSTTETRQNFIKVTDDNNTNLPDWTGKVLFN
jgi:hypothetical protein